MSMFLTMLVLSQLNLAAPSPQSFKIEGVITGGQAKNGFGILAIRHSKNENTERIVIDYSDLQGEPLKSEVGYFHAHLDAKNNSLSLDLAQLLRSQINEPNFKRALLKSKLIKEASMTMDPEDQSMNISLFFKEKTLVNIYSVKANSDKQVSKLIIDLKIKGEN